MKYLSLILLTIIISSCCGTKSVVEKTTNEDTQNIIKVETIETELVKETSESIEAVESKEELIEPTTIEVPVEAPIEIEASVEATVETFNHNAWGDLLQKHVSDQGTVNYKGFRADMGVFNAYLKLLSENPPQESWTQDKTLAYWMNVYNAFTVKLILDNYPTKSIKDIDGPWNHRFIKIGAKWYTLNDVEHRIIRKMGEPRIHFALVCAAVSCPRLYNKAFTALNLEEDLALLTRGFLNDSSKNNLSENSIKISKIFKWYGGDFKKNGSSLIDFLNQYSDITISSKAKKSYKDYNWALNE